MTPTTLTPRWPKALGTESNPIGDSDYLNARRCVAKMRTGRRCTRTVDESNSNTDSCCTVHNVVRRDARLAVEGRYQKYLSEQTVHDAFLSFLDDPDICDLRAELALQRTILAQALAKCEGAAMGSMSVAAMAAITEMNAAVARLAEACDKIQTRGRHAVNISQLEWFVEQVVAVASDVITDEKVLLELSESLESCVVPGNRTRASAPFGRLVRPLIEGERTDARFRDGGNGAAKRDSNDAGGEGFANVGGSDARDTDDVSGDDGE